MLDFTLLLAQEEAVAIGFLYLLCIGISMLFAVGVIGFWIWSIVDCASNEPSEGNDKVVWLLVILLLGWIGSLVYYIARRPQRVAKYGR